jgi:3-oxoacyl-[acyl-carrier-protein] synthase-3
MSAVGIWGLGKGLPKARLTNDDLVARGLDTSDEWIQTRTGIQARYIAGPDEATSDLAYMAACEAIASAKIQASEIDLVVVGTTSPDYLGFPSVACILQQRLGLRVVAAFDVASACSGFNVAMTTATQYLHSGMSTCALVVGADCLSKYVDWTDRSICVLFGDGAGAAILKPVQPGYGVLYSRLYADGSHAGILNIQGGGSRQPFTQAVLDNRSHFIHMEGRAVFKVAVTAVVDALQTALAAIGKTPADLALFIPHQANLRIVDYVREKMGLTEAQCFTNLQQYGNTSAASIPIALCEAHAQGRLQDGDLIALLGFGAGFTWGVNLIRWGGC